MKKLTRILIGMGVLCLCAVACKDYSVDIDELTDRVEELESGKIATISQQIASINNSIPSLQTADNELKVMIENLNKSAGDLSDAISANEEKLQNFKGDIDKTIAALREEFALTQSADSKELLDALKAAKAEIEGQIAALQEETGKKVAQMDSTITVLKDKDTALEAKIADLKTFVTDSLTSTKKWAEKTFATLEQQEAIQKELSAVKGSVTSLQTSMEEMEQRITENYTKAIQEEIGKLESKLQSEFEGKLSDQAKEITDAYTEAIAAAKEEIAEAYTIDLVNAIDTSEKEMQRWVNRTLTAYLTIADAEERLAAQKTDLETQLSTQKAYLEGLVNALQEDMQEADKNLGDLIDANKKAIKDNADAIQTNADAIKKLGEDLEQAKKDIETAYKAAIKDAVDDVTTAYTTAIDNKAEELTDKINNLNTELSGKISDVDKKVSNLTSAVAVLQNQVDGISDKLDTVSDKLDAFISGRVQSISYVPSAADRTVALSRFRDDFSSKLNLNFEVRPHSMASKITADQMAVQVKYYGSDAAVSTVEVESVSGDAETGILTVTVDPLKVFPSDLTTDAAVSVSVQDKTDGYYDVASEYVSVKVNVKYAFIAAKTLSGAYTPKDLIFYNSNGSTVASTQEADGSVYYIQAPKEATRMKFNNYSDSNVKSVSFGPAYAGSTGIPMQAAGDAVFQNDPKLTYVDFGQNGLRTDEVTTFERMFNECASLTGVDMKYCNTANVTNMQQMFRACSSLKDIDLSTWSTSKVTTVMEMFLNCSSLKNIDLSAWKTPALTDVTNFFQGCSSLETVSLKGWDLSHVTIAQGMFADCTNLKYVDFTGVKWPTTGVKSALAMFRGTSITKVENPVSKALHVQNLASMFEGCSKLETVNLSGFVLIKKYKMGIDISVSNMFLNCAVLTNVNLSRWNVSNLKKLSQMFKDCPVLDTVDLSGWKLNEDADVTDMFKNTPVKKVILKDSDDTTIQKIKSVLPEGTELVTE